MAATACLQSARPNLGAHICNVANLLAYADLHDVILCGHSYAGMVSGVADWASHDLDNGTVSVTLLNTADSAIPDGVRFSPFGRWFDRPDAQAAAKVVVAVTRMGAGNFGDHRAVGAGVVESRIDFGPGYRIYFGRDGDALVILLVGGTKKRQQQDIAAAKALLAGLQGAQQSGTEGQVRWH